MKKLNGISASWIVSGEEAEGIYSVKTTLAGAIRDVIDMRIEEIDKALALFPGAGLEVKLESYTPSEARELNLRDACSDDEQWNLLTLNVGGEQGFYALYYFIRQNKCSDKKERAVLCGAMQPVIN